MTSKPGMRQLPLANRFRRHLRLGVVVLLILSNILSATGFPIQSIAASQKDLSQPYPCMHLKCGCLSAEQCWRGSCCCMTMSEKLAWAASHAIEAPRHAHEAAKCESPAAGSCCKKKPAEERHETTWVLSMQARKCQNQGPLIVFATPVAVPPLPSVLPTIQTERIESITFVHEHVRVLSHRPAVPPPRPGAITL